MTRPQSILLFFLLALLPSSTAQLSLSWTNNMLRVSGPNVPGEFVEVWYLEAFCRSGSTHQDWNKTTIPHKTELLRNDQGKTLLLRTVVEPQVVILHQVKAGQDEVTFDLTVKNEGEKFQDVQWFQPCIRVNRFTGRTQQNYPERSFIYTKEGLRTLDKVARTEEAIYKGGQVYVPAGIPLEDVNPRPISPEKPVNGLMGCFSADNKWLFATAWSDTQELFQGVIVCIHNDPRIGGLNPGQEKKLTGRIYILPNDPALLLARYNKDFPRSK